MRWATPAAGGGGSTVAIGTTLPASPTDGQEAVLVDSLTAPTYAWRLRYTAGITDAKKWVYVGGAPFYAEDTNLGTTGSASYVALATAGPSFALPRAGDYLIETAFTGIAGLAAGGGCMMSYDIGGTAANDVDAVYLVQPDANTASGPRVQASVMRRARKVGLTAVTLTTKYRSTGGTAAWYYRSLSVTPVRVA
jgi:hypothetical protein